MAESKTDRNKWKRLYVIFPTFARVESRRGMTSGHITLNGDAVQFIKKKSALKTYQRIGSANHHGNSDYVTKVTAVFWIPF